MKEFNKDNLKVKIMPTRKEMGEVAAKDIHDRIIALLGERDEINMIFAAAPSQNDVLKSLIAWNKPYFLNNFLNIPLSALLLYLPA